jgi:hypothetical protein
LKWLLDNDPKEFLLSRAKEKFGAFAEIDFQARLINSNAVNFDATLFNQTVCLAF